MSEGLSVEKIAWLHYELCTCIFLIYLTPVPSCTELYSLSDSALYQENPDISSRSKMASKQPGVGLAKKKNTKGLSLTTENGKEGILTPYKSVHIN